jgi:hypothetical protein
MRKYVSTLLIAALVAITGCSQSSIKTESSTDSQEVLNAFTNLNASTEVGITYNKYIEKLTDVNTALAKYKESGKAKKSQLDLFQKAFDGYLIAGEFWGCEFKGLVNFEEYKCRDNQILAASALLPDVAGNKGVKDAITNKLIDDSFSKKLDKKGVLTLIWLSSQKQITLAKK